MIVPPGRVDPGEAMVGDLIIAVHLVVPGDLPLAVPAGWAVVGVVAPGSSASPDSPLGYALRASEDVLRDAGVVEDGRG